jgi:hypothetical protein
MQPVVYVSGQRLCFCRQLGVFTMHTSGGATVADWFTEFVCRRCRADGIDAIA